MSHKKRKLGWGSLSFLLFIIGFVIVIQYIVFSIGDDVMAVFGQGAFSSLSIVDPIYIYFSFFFTIPSVIIGYVYKNHWGARVGRSLSLTLILCITAWFVGYYIGEAYILPKF